MTAHRSGDLAVARAAAIESSGRGVPFHLVQFRNACFWVFLWGVAAGILQMVGRYGPGIGAYRVGLGIGILGFAFYAIPWLLLLSYHNRYTSLPAKPLLVAFVWGALAATFWMASQANSAVLSLYGKAFGQGWANDWGAGLAAPFTEETAKATALVLLLGLAPRLVRTPYDGLMIGAFAGLGFQVLEDILYAYNNTVNAFGADQTEAAVFIVLVRGITGLFGHVLFSAVFCAGLMWLLGRGEGSHRLRGLLLMLGALVAHGTWDVQAALGQIIAGNAGIVLMLLVLPIADLLLLWITFRLAAPEEQARSHAILEPETETGLLTQAEVGAAAGGWRTRRAYRRTLHDRREKKNAKHILAAAHDLARELARSGGHDTPSVQHARTEIQRLRATA